MNLDHTLLKISGDSFFIGILLRSISLNKYIGSSISKLEYLNWVQPHMLHCSPQYEPFLKYSSTRQINFPTHFIVESSCHFRDSSSQLLCCPWFDCVNFYILSLEGFWSDFDNQPCFLEATFWVECAKVHGWSWVLSMKTAWPRFKVETIVINEW